MYDFYKFCVNNNIDMAPELTKKEKYNHSVDLWCAGIILYELLTGDTPFRDLNGDPNITKLYIQNSDLRHADDWKSVPQKFQEFLLIVLEKDRKKRSNASDL